MIAEDEEITHSHNVMPVLWISPGVQKLQDANLDTSLRSNTNTIAC